MGNNEAGKQGSEGEFGGLIFVACMFIGGGLGLAFGEVAAGWLIGMGVGFLLMGLLQTRKIKPTPIRIGLSCSIRRIVLAILGILIIISGVALLYGHRAVIFRYLPGIVLVGIGVVALIAGLGGGSKSEGTCT